MTQNQWIFCLLLIGSIGFGIMQHSVGASLFVFGLTGLIIELSVALFKYLDSK